MNTDDRRLIAECLKGRTASFGDLVRRYQDRLFNAVYRVLDNTEDTHDVVQEAFLNAYQSLNSFKGDSEFFTWLYRIAFNAAITLKRKRRTVSASNMAAMMNSRTSRRINRSSPAPEKPSNDPKKRRSSRKH